MPENTVKCMEGSSFGLRDDQAFGTKEDRDQKFVDRFKATAGLALVSCSAQNIDRVVTIYRTAKRCCRTLVIDAYAAEVLEAKRRARESEQACPF